MNKPNYHFKNIVILFLSVIIFFLLGLSTGFAPFSFAQQTLICPTPMKSGNNELQLIPCYINSTTVSPAPTTTTPSLPTLTIQLPTGQSLPTGTSTTPGASTHSGGACQSDSIVMNSCTCPSYLERDAICIDAQCRADGGVSFDASDPEEALGTTAGVPKGVNCVFPASGLSPGTNPTPNGNATSCVTECNSKPVIYLYPTHTMNVNVSLSLQGTITTSIPQYPSSGWQNILAHPDGSLLYDNQSYHELYYESATVKATPLNQGIFIPTSQLQPQLETLTTQLGLNPSERQEFISYWVPRLTSLHSPYILFSLFPPDQKAIVDDVHITPKPDTFIQFLAYFKPVESIYPIQPLQIPQPPKRTGFTAVEWGGTVDK